MTSSKRVHFGVFVLAGALSLPYFAACSEDSAATTPGVGGTAGSGGSGGTGGGTTGSGGTGGVSTTGGPSSKSLFACELALSCDPVCSHLGGVGDCGGDAACVESVWDSGDSGVLLFQSRPGPGNYQSDTLFVLLGDGQALRQLRSRSCAGGDASCDLEAISWSVEPQARCNVGDDFSQLEDCVTVDYSCDDVSDGLAGTGGAGGAGGSAGGGGEAGAGHAGEAGE